VDEHGIFETTQDLTAKPYDLQAAFDRFEEACEQACQQRWFLAADHALNSPTGLTAIHVPPAAISAIQSDGYKIWMDNPEYPAGKTLADARTEEIKEIKHERFRAMESVLLEYLRFILKCNAFRTMVAMPFASMDHVRSTLAQRCGDYWFEHFDQEFDEWLDLFFGDLDISSVIAADTRSQETDTPAYTTFQQAMNAARYITMTEGVQVFVERDDHKWTVSQSTSAAPVQDEILCDHDDLSADETFDDLPSDDYDKDSEDVRQEIIDEANDFSDGLALSDSDGWFYPD
jgi:hypothetical protein